MPRVKSPPPPRCLLDAAALNSAADFTGDLQQNPRVSAVKKDGVPLQTGTQGKTVEREAKTVHIYSFNFNNTPPIAAFRVHCSKGTYVRSLAHELGQKLDCGAHLSTLHRTRSGVFEVAKATRLEELVTLPDAELPGRVLSLLELTRLLKPE